MSAPRETTPLDSETLRQRARLYLYGELSLAERREIERCRDEDPAFRALLEDEQAFLLSLGGPELDCDMEPLLEKCRGDLDAALAGEDRSLRASSLAGRLGARLRSLRQIMASRPLAWQPALAVVLLVIGFAAGRTSTDSAGRSTTVLPLGAFDGSDPSQQYPELTGVEAVRLDPADSQVQIVFEERRVVTGDSSDPFIKALLLNTVQGSGGGARLSSLEALRRHASDSEVRRALLRSMLDDENPGIRLTALDAVREQAAHPEVRDALVQTLRTDPNTGMRVHAIQLLREFPSRDLAGPLQDLVQMESNEFVVAETHRILHDLGASTEHY